MTGVAFTPDTAIGVDLGGLFIIQKLYRVVFAKFLECGFWQDQFHVQGGIANGEIELDKSVAADPSYLDKALLGIEFGGHLIRFFISQRDALG